MTEPPERFWKIFFEVYEPLPRQGPGSRSSAERALALCTDLPASPEVFDAGCGTGGQTIQLAELTDGHIVAIDSHAPSIELLKAKVAGRGLDARIDVRVGDMASPGFEPGSLDLIWSEGAVYNIGVETALRTYFPLLRPGGYFAFTEAVWLKSDAPAEVRAGFEEYAAMGSVADALRKIEQSDFVLVDHFTLPNEDWWTDFYEPMEHRIAELRRTYDGDEKALGVLDELAKEPAMHRRYAEYYGYEFFVSRR